MRLRAPKGGLQSRIFVGVMMVALVSVLTSGVLVRNRMLASFRSLGPDRLAYRADIRDYLNIAPLYTGDLESLGPDVSEAAKRGGERVVLTDDKRNVIADSDPNTPFIKDQRIDFIIAVPVTRREERNLVRTSMCFAAARLFDWSELPDRFINFQDLVAAIDKPPEGGGGDVGDEFDQAIATLGQDARGSLKECLSSEFEFDGPRGSVFVGNGQEERFRLGSLGPWAGLLVGLLSLAGLLAFLVSRRITKPLRTLTSATTKLSHGNLSDRIETGGSAEVGELTAAFNSLADRLESAERQRTQIMRDVAHELRNPLGVLQSQLEAAIDGVVPMDDRALEVMHEEVGQLTSLVNDLQQLAGFDAGSISLQRGAVSLGDLVQSVVDNNRIAHGDLRFDCDVHNVTVQGDMVRLRQVVSNLIRNAIQHTPPGGTVTANVALVGRVAVMAISDTGAGIPDDQIPHVFERLWRGDDSRRREESDRGAGLGLSICKAIVEAHRGTIAVSSGLGKGTTFSVTLPDAT